MSLLPRTVVIALAFTGMIAVASELSAADNEMVHSGAVTQLSPFQGNSKSKKCFPSASSRVILASL